MQKDIELDLEIQELVKKLGIYLESTFGASVNDNLPRLSKKGKYEVFFVMHDEAPEGIIVLENKEADTFQHTSWSEHKLSRIVAERNLKMKKCKAYKKSIDERVKVKIGEL